MIYYVQCNIISRRLARLLRSTSMWISRLEWRSTSPKEGPFRYWVI